MNTNKIIIVLKYFLIITIIFITFEFSYGQADTTAHLQESPGELEEFNVTIPKEISPVKSNKLPIVNFEISTVSKRSFTAPVWLKFYPSGTYDPDGNIILFEMDMNGDGKFDVIESTLTGSSYEFTIPGEYIASVRVTDDKGAITIKSKSFVINKEDNQAVDKDELEDVEIVKKDDSTIDQSSKSFTDQITVIPSNAWEETTIPWIEVWAPNGNSIITKEVDINTIPKGNFKSISSIISIEPQNKNSILGAIKVKMPEAIHVPDRDKGRVVLAFYEEGYSPCTGKVESRWRFHSVDYDPGTGIYEAQMNHGCFIVWGLITLGAGVSYLAWDDATRLLMTKKESDHFVLHYDRSEIPEETVTLTINKLESARTFFIKDNIQGGLGLDYPNVPAKLDVYFVSIKSESETYGLYQIGKTGARWIDLNLPSNIQHYNQNKLSASVVHELFHFIQFSQYNNSIYGWLNEALSSAVELTYVKTKYFVPDNKSPILDSDMLIKGLKGLKEAAEGYSAGLFIDFLVHRYGVAIYSIILEECKRQVESVASQDPLIAIQRAISRLGRQHYPSDKTYWELDAAWQSFTDAFIIEKSGPPIIDERPDRKIPYTNKGTVNITVGENVTIQKWSIQVPSLSLKPLASRTYNISPNKWNDEDKAIIDFNVTFTPEDDTPFNISTLIAFYNKKGEKALLPIQSRILGRINDKTLDLSFTLNLEKKNRFNLISFIPTGLGAKKEPGVAKGSYQFSYKLRKEEKIEAFPEVPISTNAIDNYWWAYLKTAIEIKNSDKNTWDIINESPLDALYDKAESNWKPINERIIAISKRQDAIDKDVSPVLDMMYKYYDARNKMLVETSGTAKSLSQEKWDLLMEISNNYNDAGNACGFTVNAYENFSNIRTIGMKATVLVHPNRLRYLHIGESTELPSQMEIQKVLDKFHQYLAQISPCQRSLSSFEKYWEKNKGEALKIIEEIKILYPSLNE